MACPYSSEYEIESEFRMAAASMVAAKLTQMDFAIFSPLSQSQSVLEFIEPSVATPDFWLERDLSIVRKCDTVLVLPMWGFDKSKGVAREVNLAHDLHIPVKFVIIQADFVMPFEMLEQNEFYQIYSKGTVVL